MARDWSESTFVLVSDKPEVLAEGMLVEILLDPEEAELSWSNDQKSVIFTFKGESGYFINIYDFRTETVNAMTQDDINEVYRVFRNVPCLGTMRKSRSQYLALADVGDSRSDIKPDIELALGRGGPKNLKYRVANNCAHCYTRIALLEPREGS